MSVCAARSENKQAKGTSAMAKSLLAIARCCKAVVACRVSPSQKAAIVRLVRGNIRPEPMTLAIGVWACMWLCVWFGTGLAWLLLLLLLKTSADVVNCRFAFLVSVRLV